ncbi:MAG: response regulator transcription factor [Halioglobus sp.]
MSNRVLIIDDDTELCSLLIDFLTLESFEASAIHNGLEAVEHCQDTQYDAIVLDIMLPGMQGLDVLRQLRKFTETPILMLTARGEDTDRIVGLELGADDYLPKPCNPRELAARLRAVLRRAQHTVSSTAQRTHAVAGQGSVDIAGTCLNASDRSATCEGKDLRLTSAEFSLLQMLMKHAGHVVSKEALSEEALGRGLSAYDRSIDVHISKIRKKFSAIGRSNPIVSVRGQGYQFTVAPQGQEP